MTTTANSFDHVLSELRIKPDDMLKMSSPSTPPTYSSIRDFQKALNHNSMTIHSYQTELGHLALVVSEETLLPTRTKSSSLLLIQALPLSAPVNPSSRVSTRSQSDQTPENNTFNAVDSIRTFTFQQLAYQKYIAAKTALRNLILQ